MKSLRTDSLKNVEGVKEAKIGRYDIRAPRTTGHQPNWAPVQVGTNTTGHHSELEQQGTSALRHQYNWAPNVNLKKKKIYI